ncbi:MAG: HupE/UreJ family protein [Verrucomicrobiota bacterium]
MTPPFYFLLSTFHSAAGGLAHLVQTGFGGFYDGIAHWALSPRDLLVTLGMALLGGLGGTKVARTVTIAFPLAWAIGGIVGMRLPSLGELTWATTLSVGLIGLLVASSKVLQPKPAIALAAITGLLHGLANGSVVINEELDFLALVGCVLAVALVTLIGSAFLSKIENPAGHIAMRVGGSWLAAIALLWCAWLLRSST